MREKLFWTAEVLVILGAAGTGSYADSARIGIYVFLAGTAIVAIVKYFVTGPRR